MEYGYMKNIFCLIMGFLFTVGAMAQPLNGPSLSTNKKLAQQLEEEKDYYNAVEYYENVYKETKDYEVAAKLANLYYQVREYRKASTKYRAALRKDKKGEYTEMIFDYARCAKMNGDCETAIEQFNKYIAKGADSNKKELARAEIKGCETFANAKEVDGVTVNNAGKGINTKYSEYSAVWDPTGKVMYFAAPTNWLEEKEDDKKKDTGTNVSEIRIYSAQRTDDGLSEPTDLGENINRPEYLTANVSISKDGQRLYFTRQLLDGVNLSESKIYISEKEGNGWGAAAEVNGLNGPYLATHPATGELRGREVMFFVSNMDGGYGGWDIYYAAYKGNGVYGDPINLGPKINTAGDEVTPFYLDGSLYFSSTGHPGMGGYDVFQSNWDGSTWSIPRNMGLGVNSNVDDKYYNLEPQGYRGFVLSNRTGTARSYFGRTCCDDIYSVSYKIINADAIAGTYDVDTGKPLSGSSLEIQDITGDEAKTVSTLSNPSAHDFNFPLELDREYRVIASRPDYYNDTLYLNTEGLLDSKTYTLIHKMKPAPVFITITQENPIVLNNILYDFDDDKILPAAEQDLEFIYEIMTQYPEMVIELSSNTDRKGEAAYNLGLSQRRAESARRWLMAKGIERKRVLVLGNGESNPFTVTEKLNGEYPFLPVGQELTPKFINTLENDEQKDVADQINRRTEFQIIKGPKSIKIEESKLIRKGVTEIKE